MSRLPSKDVNEHKVYLRALTLDHVRFAKQEKERREMKKISTANAEHYTWSEVCDGWHLVKQSSLSVIKEQMPPGAAEVRHLHRRAQQFFYVLSGVVVIELEGLSVDLAPGEGLEIAPGVAHQVKNRSDVDVEFLVVSQPHSHGDRETV
jgi:mannose-6-phosphate isomerase-like protein (cupin superfamily)